VSASPLKVLIVDDEPPIRKLLRMGLSTQGYEILDATNGKTALALLDAKPDLIILDLGLPDMQGLDLLAAIRARNESVPIVVLSSRSDESVKVRALDLGADDFVVKPFSGPELLARVRAQLRRAGNALETQFNFPDLSIDVKRRRVVQGGREIRLTPTEFAILEVLARHAGRPVSFDELIAFVWKGAPATSNDAVRVHVGALRRKLEPDPSSPRYIVTEPWIGYRFIAEPVPVTLP
jgi:two-component system KDP operon response regulator KdpE